MFIFMSIPNIKTKMLSQVDDSCFVNSNLNHIGPAQSLQSQDSVSYFLDKMIKQCWYWKICNKNKIKYLVPSYNKIQNGKLVP